MRLERVGTAILLGLRDFFHPRVMMLSFVVLVLGLVFWGAFLALVGGPLLVWISQLTSWDFTGFWGGLLLVVISFPLVVIVSLILLSVLAFPWVRRFLRRRGYQDRAATGETGLGRQVFEMAWVSGLGIMTWILLLALFWVPVLPAVLGVLVLGWVQWRLIGLDHWSTNQSWTEIKRLRRSYGFEGWVLGSILALGSLVPILNLFLPVLSALSFAHWDGELRREKN